METVNHTEAKQIHHDEALLPSLVSPVSVAASGTAVQAKVTAVTLVYCTGHKEHTSINLTAMFRLFGNLRVCFTSENNLKSIKTLLFLTNQRQDGFRLRNITRALIRSRETTTSRCLLSPRLNQHWLERSWRGLLFLRSCDSVKAKLNKLTENLLWLGLAYTTDR